MAIVKIKVKEKNYMQIEKTGIEDSSLSWAATGLLTYLIGRPENWNIVMEHLKTVKTDGRDSTRSALNNLREFNYCHYFEIREKGKIIETVYLIFEKPTSVKEAERQIEVTDGQEVYYKKFEKDYSKKVINKEEQPKTGNPFSAKPFPENPTLLIIDSNNNRINNKRTTTSAVSSSNEEKEVSSSYEFLDLSKYKLLNLATKKNIEKNIKNLTKEKFTEVYNLALEYVKSGKGESFNAILYKGLIGEWIFPNVEKQIKEIEPLKRKWLSYFAGIVSNQALKNEIENIIINIPIEILNTNKNQLARMNTFEFKQHLISLRRKY